MRKVYHTLSKVGNSDRFTHIEDKYFAAMSHCSCLKNELASLWNEHEETYDVRMCHRNRTALLYLFLENRNDRTVRAQHIAKAGGDELGCWLWVVGCRLRHIALIRAISYRLIERLTIYLAYTL